MMLRHLRLLTTGLLALGAAAGAHAWDDWEDEPQTRLEGGYRSRQLLRGVVLANDGARGTAEVFYRGARLEAELAVPFRGDSRLAHLTGSYRRAFGEDHALTALTVHRRFGGEVGSLGRRHATELGLAYSRTVTNGPTVTLDLRRDLRLRANLTELSLAHQVALTRLGAFLEWSAFAGWVDAEDIGPDGAGPRRADAHGYAGARARLPYRVGERLQIVAEAEISGTRGADPSWSARGGDSGLRTAVGLALRLDF